MIFNSIEFALFLPLVFILYWFVFKKNLKIQNTLLILASYVFYGWWDWRFLSLIIFSSCVDYFVGLGLSKHDDPGKRKALLMASILVNLGFLGFFKYFNFFADSFAQLISVFGLQVNPVSLKIILPVGISFYTFQTMSYTIDVYKRKMQPTGDVLAFFAYVSFFPQLVAGPIERATHLLPQFLKKREFNYSQAVDGLKQILWGLFKKIVIADNCAKFANEIFNNSQNMSGSTLVLGAVFFAFQIYGDFSGYSDIAIGTSRLFGFGLMQNFAVPYFSRDIAEFWRRWHISLSSWFRDYVYIPLGGSRGGTGMKIRNTFIIFLLSGLWHGANWTFVCWGFINALYFLPLLLGGRNRAHLGIAAEGRTLPTWKELGSILLTFALTVFAWIFFRADSLSHAFSYIGGIFSRSLFTLPVLADENRAIITAALIVIFTIIEWLGREENFALAKLGKTWKWPARWILYYGIILVIYFLGGAQQEFIYFQF